MECLKSHAGQRRDWYTLCVPSSFKAIGVPTGEVGWGREHQVREEGV